MRLKIQTEAASSLTTSPIAADSPGRRRWFIVFGAQPVDPDVGTAAQEQSQLTGMVLGVTEIVEQELADVQFVPPEPAPLESAFVVRGDGFIRTGGLGAGHVAEDGAQA